jgi:DNA-binding response OmpR family regulator
MAFGRLEHVIVKRVNAFSKRILIADDDPTICALVSSVVKKEGFTPVVVNDGREAFKVLKEDADFVAAIFDVQMPHIEGPELIRHMQTENRLKRIPTMIITAEENPRVNINSLDAGALVFLPKPFTPTQLQMMLRMLIRKGDAPEI